MLCDKDRQQDLGLTCLWDVSDVHSCAIRPRAEEGHRKVNSVL
jgi:hypothetical protein